MTGNINYLFYKCSHPERKGLASAAGPAHKGNQPLCSEKNEKFLHCLKTWFPKNSF